jgi:hypothetical protein
VIDDLLVLNRPAAIANELRLQARPHAVFWNGAIFDLIFWHGTTVAGPGSGVAVGSGRAAGAADQHIQGRDQYRRWTATDRLSSLQTRLVIAPAGAKIMLGAFR